VSSPPVVTALRSRILSRKNLLTLGYVGCTAVGRLVSYSSSLAFSYIRVAFPNGVKASRYPLLAYRLS
jgi:hypothetical protein